MNDRLNLKINQKLISNPIIMNKNISKNSDYLTKLGRRAKGEATPKVGKLIEMYNFKADITSSNG